MMKNVLKHYCYPLNFLACVCSRNAHGIIGQSFLNILIGIGSVQDFGST